ncbi:MAG: hypothetical protein MJ051_02980 [Akkermansia sp.]|nr:hypothetical protein [Akkermansia sp.]
MTARTASIRPVMIAILLAIFVAHFGNGIWDLLLANCLSDVHGLSTESRGLMELPRELPGVLSFFVICCLFFLNEVRLAAVACLLTAVGAFGFSQLGAGTTFLTLSLWVLLTSLGQHIFMGTVDSIVMHTARPENRGLRLGQMRALCTAAMLCGAAYIWLKWKFNSSFTIDYLLMALALGAAAVLLFAVRAGGDFPARRSWKECFIYRREYKVYYGLEILHGIRKQLYLTFGYWLMVNTLEQSPAIIGMVILIAGVIGLFTQPLIGWSIKRFGEKRVTIFDSVALSLLCAAYAFAPDLFPRATAVYIVAGCFVLDNLLFAMGMARTTYIARVCGERHGEITPCIYTGLAINHVASIAFGVAGGIIWQAAGGPQLVFLIGAAAVIAAGLLARRM